MSKTPRKKKVPYYKKPQELTVEAWQEAPRKIFATDQKFEVTNIGEQVWKLVNKWIMWLFLKTQIRFF